ncbi:MAG: Chorismate mutase I (EC / Prephenate dehydratase (EC [uncultured Thiotrichaceae bacterium]|uniref:Bifunctional chorismate mutase/prephenate dehydratase n=1 Tax=uncultured Thiotrichaceae bacterium TaxID=298394 RepID=A0A6S6TS97_9GAMM|nr:MAG: Chorismate mutase I (EC / Prephenate dehydratase (EC [uncultured Thiotrichaceae bacterium]
MSDSEKLLALRNRIDAVDSKILELLAERANCAEEVAVTKKASLPEGEEVCFYRPEREAQILQRMVADNPGPLRKEQITKIYRSIISSCLALEECLEVAYLGPKGTFTHSALQKHFGAWVTALPQESIAQVFQEVDTGRAHYGVIPVENSTGGVVTHTLDRFIESPLFISGEVQLPIHQNLMTMNEDWRSVKTIYSHQQSLLQCRHWIEKSLPNAKLIPVSSNGEAARLASENVDTAAIAGVAAAGIFGLKYLQKNIEDQANNTTRFLIIGMEQVPPSGNDKTSLMVSAKNEPGSLFKLLKPLADHGLDMSRIESRPAKSGNWEYIFFLDIMGHRDDPEVKIALEQLEEGADFLRVLGSYPKAIA